MKNVKLADMTLRDYFAVSAMNGVLANPDRSDFSDSELIDWSYENADAMMARRDRVPNGDNDVPNGDDDEGATISLTFEDVSPDDSCEIAETVPLVGGPLNKTIMLFQETEPMSYFDCGAYQYHLHRVKLNGDVIHGLSAYVWSALSASEADQMVSDIVKEAFSKPCSDCTDRNG